MAIEAGASALGLVSHMPSGPGVIDEDSIRHIADHIPPGIASFLLTSLQSVDDIVMQHSRCRTNTIQLCDDLVDGAHSELKERLPGIGIVQVIHVEGEEAVQQALRVAPYVHAILLDSGSRKTAIRELGGTGRSHDWTISRRICAHSPVPVYLAGGLTPENVSTAVDHVQPSGLDVCNGVRTEGMLDSTKLARFFEAIDRSSVARAS